MLVRLTNYCKMGCSHCLSDANQNGKHMDIDTFKSVLKFTKKYDNMIFLSGGEPTNNPYLFDFIELILNENINKKFILIMSNGLFLNDNNYTKQLLSYGIDLQITNDSRYYPKKINKIKHQLLTYVDKIEPVSPFGRALKNNIPITQKYPSCFNLRSLVYSFNSFEKAINTLRYKAYKFCTPSINVDESINAGESPSCSKIGTIESSNEEITNNIQSLSCNKCGLFKNLKGNYLNLWNKLNNN